MLEYIIYSILAYGGLIWIGIYLKSRGFFEIPIVRWIFAIAVLIPWGIIEMNMGYLGDEAIFLIDIIYIGIMMGIIIIPNSSIEALFVCIVWFIAWWITGGLAWLDDVGEDMGIIVALASLIIVPIVFGVPIMIVEKVISSNAKSKYNKSVEYLKNGNYSTANNYLTQIIYLLKYSSDEHPYFNKELIEKATLLKDNIDTLQKIDEYYKSGNYIKAYELYNNLKPEVKELFKEKYSNLKNHIKEEFEKLLQKADNLFKNNEIKKALFEYQKLLSLLYKEYISIKDEYENVIIKKLKKCEEILS